jgi:hypothetical protein
MGLVHAEITLKNAGDVFNARRGATKELEIRQTLENTGEVLLGALPLEDMDLIVDPARQEITGAHGDEILCIVK